MTPANKASLRSTEIARVGGRPPRISRALIVHEARGIPSSELTLALIARRLGVKHSALYHHFASRDALVAELSETLIREFQLPVPHPARWRAWLTEILQGLYHFMLANPIVLEVENVAANVRIWLPLYERILAALEEAGFRGTDGLYLWNLSASFVLAQARSVRDVAALAMRETDRAGFETDMDRNYPRLKSASVQLARLAPEQFFLQTLRWFIDGLPEPSKPQAPGPRRPRH